MIMPPRRTVSDFQMSDNPLGLAVAALSVVSSGMQQIFCRSMQQKHKLSSHELLSNTAPAQACPPCCHPRIGFSLCNMHTCMARCRWSWCMTSGLG